jgi:hypothetical protein
LSGGESSCRGAAGWCVKKQEEKYHYSIDAAKKRYQILKKWAVKKKLKQNSIAGHYCKNDQLMVVEK